jgi:predicted transcriptional regulator
MRLLCEAATLKFLPAIRALITKELIRRYNYTQTEVAKVLGITQPAVSQYKKELRGQAVRVLEKDEEVLNFIKQICAEIYTGQLAPEEIQMKFCEICKLLRKKGLIS